MFLTILCSKINSHAYFAFFSFGIGISTSNFDPIVSKFVIASAMDEFGVLTERFGLKPQGKSAPMAASKQPASSNTFHSGFNSGLNGKSSFDSGFVDVSFQKNTKPDSYAGVDDIFGSLTQSTKHLRNSASSPSSFDYDSIFFGSKNSDPSYDDVFSGIPGFKSSVTAKKEDPVRSFSPSLNQTSQVDDLFGDFSSNVVKPTPKPNGLKTAPNNGAPFDELISGFGASNSPIDRYGRCMMLEKLACIMSLVPEKHGLISAFGCVYRT